MAVQTDAEARTGARRGVVAAATAGVASVALGAGIGELAAAMLAPASSPFSVVGGVLIDLAPTWAKNAAIALFGTNDKAALLIGIALVLLVLAAGVGLLEVRRPPWGAVLCLVVGGTVAVLATTRADAGSLAWAPSAIAGVAAAAALFWLAGLARRAAASAPTQQTAADRPADGPSDESRRRFFVWAGVATATGVLAAIGGSAMRVGSRAATSVRLALHLPAPAVAAPAIPAGAELGILGLAEVITPNVSFYRIDTALIVPEIDPADWSLRIHGMVDREVTLTWDELLALPMEESVTTLTCVSNTVGGDLIGNALWLGYPIRELLKRAGPKAGADMVLSRSIDGFTASTPLEVLTDDRAAIFAVGMNGEPLPLEHGFPVRMVVPGLYGYVSATKWVVELEVTRFDQASAYWTDRGWSEKGPIKLESRIDVPHQGQGLSAGEAVIAGVAWQQHVGVAKVEVQVDGGKWQEATLASAISDDTWVQWSMPWTAKSGRHELRCRATNTLGETQTDDEAPPIPDGATGWHRLTVDVA